MQDLDWPFNPQPGLCHFIQSSPGIREKHSTNLRLIVLIHSTFFREGHFVSTQWATAKGIHRLIIRTGSSAVPPLLLYQQEGFDLISLERDYFTRHYAEPIWENGVQCRHQLVLEKRV